MVKTLSQATVATAALLASTAYAAPTVVADIAPVHALVARVLGDVALPSLVIGPGQSPHSFTLRPSQARALEAATVVFWIGHELTPALERHIETLAADATVVALLDAPGTTLHNYRETAVFGSDGDHHEEHGHDDHGHEEHGHEEHGHEEHGHEEHGHEEHGHEEHGHEEHDHDKHPHDDHAHDEHAHDDHGHDEQAHDEHGHDHEGVDAHAWLDPENAARWLDVIAETLSDVDPANAATYAANAVAGQAEIKALSDEIAATLASAGDMQVVVTHDAYQYFEHRFGFAVLGAIATGDAENPSPARIATLQDAVADSGASCVFAEPQYQDTLVRTVFSGDAVSVSVIDPLGAGLEPGAALYPALLRNLADGLAMCGHK